MGCCVVEEMCRDEKGRMSGKCEEFICGQQGSRSGNAFTEDDELAWNDRMKVECDCVIGFFQ